MSFFLTTDVFDKFPDKEIYMDSFVLKDFSLFESKWKQNKEFNRFVSLHYNILLDVNISELTKFWDQVGDLIAEDKFLEQLK